MTCLRERGKRAGIWAGLAAVAAAALAVLPGGDGEAQAPAYYPVPVIENAPDADNGFYLKIMRCAKQGAACSDAELSQAAQYQINFAVEISGEPGGLIWSDHATRPNWSGSLCTNQSGRTPSATCSTSAPTMRQADLTPNRAGTDAVVRELFRFAPPPGRSSMDITVKLPAAGQSWVNRAYQRDGDGNPVLEPDPPYAPRIDETLTTRTFTAAFSETMAEASLLDGWDFVRVNGEQRYWARDALYFKAGISTDYMVHQATRITISGPAGSFIKEAPGQAGDAACAERTTAAQMNSCVLEPQSSGGDLKHLSLTATARAGKGERLMLFSPPAGGSGTADITISVQRRQGPSHTATDSETISIRYAETVPSDLAHAYPVPKLERDFTPAERRTYEQVMNLGTWADQRVRWLRPPFSNQQMKTGDNLLTAFVGIDARNGNELQLADSGNAPTGAFASYLPWWGDETEAPADSALCATGRSPDQYAYAPCRGQDTFAVTAGTPAATAQATIIGRQSPAADGATYWSIPQQVRWPLWPGSGTGTTFGLTELHAPGDGTGVKLVTRAARGPITVAAERPAATGSATTPAFHWEFENDRSPSSFGEGDELGVIAGARTTIDPGGGTLEAACMHRFTHRSSISDSLMRIYAGSRILEQGMYDFANQRALYDAGYYETFYGFAAASRPATGTRPRHPYCTHYTVEGRYVISHQRYIGASIDPEITTEALTSGPESSAGTGASFNLPSWTSGERHLWVAVPARMGEVLRLEVNGLTYAGSDLTAVEEREIDGELFKLWYTTQTLSQSASGAMATIVQQSPSLLVVEGPAYWKTAESVADPTVRPQVLPIGYGTPYELMTCDQPPRTGGDMTCHVVDLHLEPPKLAYDASLSDAEQVSVGGYLIGIYGNSIETAFGIAGLDWQGNTAARGRIGVGTIRTAAPAAAEGSAGDVSLAARLADDADQVLQATDDRALRIGPSATVTAPSGVDVTDGCIQTFASTAPRATTWRPADGAAQSCAHDDLLDGDDSYLVLSGPATWEDGTKRLAIGTGTAFPVLHCGDIARTDDGGAGEWRLACGVKSMAGDYPRIIVDADAESGAAITVTANFTQSGSAPTRTGWRISWREGAGSIASTRWASHPQPEDRLESLFAVFELPVRDIAGVGSIVLERDGGRTAPLPQHWTETLRVRVRNGEGNTAESEDVSSIALTTSGGSLGSDWCATGTACALDMDALRAQALRTPSLIGAIPATLRTPAGPDSLSVSASAVSAAGGFFTATLEVGVRGPAVDVGVAEAVPSIHHHETDDDRDMAEFGVRAFDELPQDTGFPTSTKRDVYNAAGELQTRGFAPVTERCPADDARTDRLSCKVVVRVIAPAGNPVPTGRYYVQVTDREGRSGSAEFLVVAAAAAIAPVGEPWRGLGPGEPFDLAVQVDDRDGLPVADGTPVWFELRSRFTEDRAGHAVALAVPPPGRWVETKGGKASARMAVAGEEVALATAYAGGAYPQPEARQLIVINTRETGCDGPFVLASINRAVSFGDGLLARWEGGNGCPASALRTLLDDGWRIYLDSGLVDNWPWYAEADGEPLPGAMDFWLRRGDRIWAVPPPG